MRLHEQRMWRRRGGGGLGGGGGRRLRKLSAREAISASGVTGGGWGHGRAVRAGRAEWARRGRPGGALTARLREGRRGRKRRWA